VLSICGCIARGADAASFWPWRVRTGATGERTEATTHLDLALAYSQMEMLGDALTESAKAVLAAPERDVIAQAWPLIVDRRLCADTRQVYELARRLASSSTAS